MDIYTVSVKDPLYRAHYLRAFIRETSYMHICTSHEPISNPFEDYRSASMKVQTRLVSLHSHKYL